MSATQIDRGSSASRKSTAPAHGDPGADTALIRPRVVFEALSFEIPELIVSRVKPRLERWIRAERLQRLGLVDESHPDRLNPSTPGGWLRQPHARMEYVLDQNPHFGNPATTVERSRQARTIVPISLTPTRRKQHASPGSGHGASAWR